MSMLPSIDFHNTILITSTLSSILGDMNEFQGIPINREFLTPFYISF